MKNWKFVSSDKNTSKKKIKKLFLENFILLPKENQFFFTDVFLKIFFSKILKIGPNKWVSKESNNKTGLRSEDLIETQ